MSKRKELTNDEYWAKLDSGEILSHHLLEPGATTTDKMKYYLCQAMCHLMNTSKTDYKTMARISGKEIIQIKQMVHSHYRSFSLDILMETYEKLINSELVSESSAAEIKLIASGRMP